MNRMILVVALGMFVTLGSLPDASAQSLIVNGSFEDASVSPGASYVRLLGDDTRVTGWTLVGDTIDYVGPGWAASEGVRSFDLDGAAGDTSALRQSFATTPGVTYLVTFDLAGNINGLPTVKPMRVSADGQSADFTFDVTGRNAANMGWTQKSWTFVADDTSATLELLSLTTPATVQGWGAAVDNVAVVALPSAVPLLGPLARMAIMIGLLAMASLRLNALAET